jgi:pimeloyl-ACP methyl ester carboxylesterase
MQTRLVEFKNQNNDILRGILTVPDNNPGKGIIFLHGFERNATVEKKFKRMADALAIRGIATLRFDASGCGLSDGSFYDTTISKRANELDAAMEILAKKFTNIRIGFFAHSLGACVLASRVGRLDCSGTKIVLMAPGLNQKDILRYYFARDIMLAKNPAVGISFANYREYFDENKFLDFIARSKRMLNRLDYVGPEYFLEAHKTEMSKYFDKIKKDILHIHGTADQKVPLASLNTEFANRIIVNGGDHDLERPDLFDRWFPSAVDFLTKNNG